MRKQRRATVTTNDLGGSVPLCVGRENVPSGGRRRCDLMPSSGQWVFSIAHDVQQLSGGGDHYLLPSTISSSICCCYATPSWRHSAAPACHQQENNASRS